MTRIWNTQCWTSRQTQRWSAYTSQNQHTTHRGPEIRESWHGIHHRELILPDRNLTICNLYSLPNKAINLHILQTNSEDWMIVGDFNSHSPSWGYPSLDVKGEEVEHLIVSNHLVLINTPTDPPTFYSRAWKTTSTVDIAIATDNTQMIAKREVSEQLGGSDHKPVILTLA